MNYNASLLLLVLFCLLLFFSPTKASEPLLQMLTIHFWQWPLLRQPSAQNICSHATLNASPPRESCFRSHFMAQQANENKWAQRESGSFIVMSYCVCLLVWVRNVSPDCNLTVALSLLQHWCVQMSSYRKSTTSFVVDSMPPCCAFYQNEAQRPFHV